MKRGAPSNVVMWPRDLLPDYLLDERNLSGRYWVLGYNASPSDRASALTTIEGAARNLISLLNEYREQVSLYVCTSDKSHLLKYVQRQTEIHFTSACILSEDWYCAKYEPESIHQGSVLIINRLCASSLAATERRRERSSETANVSSRALFSSAHHFREVQLPTTCYPLQRSWDILVAMRV